MSLISPELSDAFAKTATVALAAAVTLGLGLAFAERATKAALRQLARELRRLFR